jgi:hypothetical protein
LAQSKIKLEIELDELRKRFEIEEEVSQGLKKRLLVLSRRNTALRRATRSSSFGTIFSPTLLICKASSVTRSKSNSLADGELNVSAEPSSPISRLDSHNIGSDLNNSFEFNEFDDQDIFGADDLQRILNEEAFDEVEDPLKITVQLLEEMNTTNLKGIQKKRHFSNIRFRRFY